MSDDRWSDDGRSCPYCGRRIKSGWQCSTCETGEVKAQPEQRHTADAPVHPPLENPAKELAEYIALTTAFDEAQRDGNRTEADRRTGATEDAEAEVPRRKAG